MLRHKLIDRVCCVILALTLLISALLVGAAATGKITEDTTIGYETRLFNQERVHTIDIVMDDWETFLKTATSEEYSACHMVIDGESFKNVAIRGKGNTSLSSVAAYGNNRYSFKVEFDHYQSGHTYHGLDKLSLNNLIQDNTYMKDYFAYTLMGKMGVAAPLCSFVQLNVNGQPWGLYLAVEGVEDSFLQRNYGKDHGELYKPDSMSFGGGRGNGRDFDMNDAADELGFDFGGNDQGNNGMPTPPEGFTPPEGDDSFGGSAGGSSGEAAGGSSGGPAGKPEPTATATPEPTATPVPTAAPAQDDSFGGSAGDAASGGGPASNGDAASSGMPAGEVPAMPGGAPAEGEIPQMPAGDPPADFDTNQAPGSSGDSAATPASVEPAATAPDQERGNNRDNQSFPGGPGGGFGGFGSNGDVKLQYSDDDPSSYANIFNNAKTDITAADQTRLIASLKALNEGDTSVVDTDAVIRYMAVHNFLCNDDSYTGMMVHNYYLYEENGVLSMIPWDYNLAYGGFSGGSNGTSTVNTTISRLVSMGSDSDRPMAAWITASETYMAQYKDTYQQFMTEMFDSGWFAAEIDRVQAMIDPYVQADPTAFCTYEEFLTGAETLRGFCLKRAESVRRQLQGDSTRVDASELDLSVMGTMNNGGPGGFERPGSNSDRQRKSETANAEASPAVTAAPEKKPESSRPAFDGMVEMSGMNRQNRTGDAWTWFVVCVVLLALALAAAKCYRSNR